MPRKQLCALCSNIGLCSTRRALVHVHRCPNSTRACDATHLLCGGRMRGKCACASPQKLNQDLCVRGSGFCCQPGFGPRNTVAQDCPRTRRGWSRGRGGGNLGGQKRGGGGKESSKKTTEHTSGCVLLCLCASVNVWCMCVCVC